MGVWPPRIDKITRGEGAEGPTKIDKITGGCEQILGESCHRGLYRSRPPMVPPCLNRGTIAVNKGI